MSLTAKPKISSGTKKRQGAHHRHSKGYLKTYWPYLPMIAIILVGVLINASLSTPKAVLGWQTSFNSTSLLQLTNADRSSHNEPGLSLNQALTNAAEAKAQNMVKQNYWAHTSPSGKTAEDFIIDSGYQFSNAGENLAYGFNNAQTVNTAWMNSPEHRANILDSGFSNVGFGVAESPNYLGEGPAVIVVAEYAEPASGPVTNLVTQPPVQNITRLDNLVGTNSSWVEIAVTVLITGLMVVVVLKHGLGLSKVLAKGEAYMIKNPWLDICLVGLAMVGFILVHSSGLIG